MEEALPAAGTRTATTSAVSYVVADVVGSPLSPLPGKCLPRTPRGRKFRVTRAASPRSAVLARISRRRRVMNPAAGRCARARKSERRDSSDGRGEARRGRARRDEAYRAVPCRAVRRDAIVKRARRKTKLHAHTESSTYSPQCSDLRAAAFISALRFPPSLATRRLSLDDGGRTGRGPSPLPLPLSLPLPPLLSVTGTTA